MMGYKVTRNSGRGYELTFYFVGLRACEARDAADKLVYNDQAREHEGRYDVSALVYNHLRDAEGNRITESMVQRTFIGHDTLAERVKKIRPRSLAVDSARSAFEANEAWYSNTQATKGPTFGDRTHGTHGPAKSKRRGRASTAATPRAMTQHGSVSKGLRRQLERVRRQNYGVYVDQCLDLGMTPQKRVEA